MAPSNNSSVHEGGRQGRGQIDVNLSQVLWSGLGWGAWSSRCVSPFETISWCQCVHEYILSETKIRLVMYHINFLCTITFGSIIFNNDGIIHIIHLSNISIISTTIIKQ